MWQKRANVDASPNLPTPKNLEGCIHAILKAVSIRALILATWKITNGRTRVKNHMHAISKVAAIEALSLELCISTNGHTRVKNRMHVILKAAAIEAPSLVI